MTDTQNTKDALEHSYQNRLPTRIFRRLVQLTFALGLLTTIYWIFFASDRYVSEANVIIRKTDSANMPTLDLTGLVSGTGANPVNRADQLLLRDYLLSVDMLKKLDAQLDLRKHFSDSRHDFVSRMWFKNASVEWFYRYYLSMVDIEYDEYAGVLRITVQAYDPKIAHAMAAMLVQDGEQYMNLLGHQMAEAQISFLTNQVEEAQDRFQKASQAVLAYQNKEGLISPTDTAQSIGTIVGNLEAQRAQLQTQLASLPTSLDPNHPNIVLLKQALGAIDRQIAEENAKLARPAGKTLNASVEEFQRLQMQMSLSEDLYKSALLSLEKGRADSLRLLEKVSVLQSPTMPEFSMEPRRLYNVIVTLLITFMVAGILKLLESIVLDHVD
ncbi:chain-length determining protein [Paraburkholderia lycopersici]|uniref:Capsular polysaccharide transport system permease protein n=1 Tax=Paraburkholderia lycopersici TaxID=416944 RepID=A0A1G6NJA9_9BURK|nr:chain-length determining protein [Paraburkholderia lycopersici]SDC67215.1 capsular polysaccharide transport system permease protein [Paraburkholderia lycopersici]